MVNLGASDPIPDCARCAAGAAVSGQPVCRGLLLGGITWKFDALLALFGARKSEASALTAPTHRRRAADTSKSNVLGHPLHSANVSALSEKVVAFARSFDGWADETLSKLIVNCRSPRATVDPLDNSRCLGIILADHISTFSAGIHVAVAKSSQHSQFMTIIRKPRFRTNGGRNETKRRRCSTVWAVSLVRTPWVVAGMALTGHKIFSGRLKGSGCV